MTIYHCYARQYQALFTFFTVLLFTSCSAASKDKPPVTDTVPTTIPATYKLVWSDEFDGSAVNTADWNFETGGGGWGNHEQEFYQAPNATLADGNLVITGKKEDAASSHYTSSRMTTQGRHEFLYGKIEARIKIPVGQGIWPAFWMLGADINTVSWPACGETDIMEHINADSLLYGTLHWDNNGHQQSGNSVTYMPSQYHVYAVEWDATSIRWLLDSVEYHKVNIYNNANSTDECHKPFFILLNLALGGDWPGQTIDDSKLPALMYVDYVRVYQKK